MNRRDTTVDNITEKLANEEYINNHKDNLTDFTRNRVLNFVVVFMLILKKSAKSLQLTLNELFMNGDINRVVSSSAYTQARKKFKHTAFIELNDDTIAIYYSDDKIKTWKGYRCLGVDGSMIKLPDSQDVENVFGSRVIHNQHKIEEKYSSALFVCCYDVLNHIAIRSILAHQKSYEVDLASQMLEAATDKDVLVYDRGFVSYPFLARLSKDNKNYVIRCTNKSFTCALPLFNQQGSWSQSCTLKANKRHHKTLKEEGLPLEIEVRFIRVILPTGEVEVLITSLTDPSITSEEFKELYSLRWGIESFFSLLKSRLNLENFTGKSAESVRQDFWSTIFISNLETVMTENLEEELNAATNKKRYEQKINKAVSFNTIKNMAFDLFFNEKDKKKRIDKLDILFKTNPIVQRPDRSPPRSKSTRRSYNFQKRIKKQVF